MDAHGRFRTLSDRLHASGSDVVALTTMATLILLQGFRVFVPYLVFEIDQSERVTLATIAVVVFGLTYLGAILYRLFGGRITLWLAVVLLTVARLWIQFTEDAGARWMLGAAIIVAWSWLLIVLLPTAGNQIAAGIGFAFALDLTIRGVRGTLDLPWMPGIAEHLATVVIGIAVVLAAYSVASSMHSLTRESALGQSLRFAGIGSGVALWLVAAGNPGFAEVRGQLGLPAAFGLLASGALVALMLQAGVVTRWKYRLDERIATLLPGLLGMLAVICWRSGASRWLDVLFLPVFAAAVATLTMRSATAIPSTAVTGRWRCGAALTLGLLVQTVFVFAYFARSGPIELLLFPVIMLALAPLAGGQVDVIAPPERAALRRAVAVLALAAAATFGWLIVDATEGASHPPNAANLTIMTFNIQEGFSNENYWSLEETARTIEAYDPDIVVLQETTRGWLVMSSVDEVRWLADRLEMDFAYGGNSHDGLWGNAILSRFPIVSSDAVVYSTTKNLERGAVAIEVATTGGNLLVIDTHLDNLRDGTAVRLEQIEELLAFWDGVTPAIVAGDFNADPGSPEWQALTDAGFVDAAGDDPTTTSEDERRIDYVFVTPDLVVDDYMVPDVWTSDHRPVVVELSAAP